MDMIERLCAAVQADRQKREGKWVSEVTSKGGSVALTFHSADWDAPLDDLPESVREDLLHYREELRADVRAALEAMREPLGELCKGNGPLMHVLRAAEYDLREAGKGGLADRVVEAREKLLAASELHRALSDRDTLPQGGDREDGLHA